MVLIRVDTVRNRPTQRALSTDTLFAFEIRHIRWTVYRGEIRIYTVRLFRPTLHKAGPLGRYSSVYTVEILTTCTSYALVPCAVQLLAHLSRRLIGELIGYSWSGVRPSVVVHNAQRSSSLKPLGQSKPNFMWSLLGKGERKFIKMVQVT